MTQTPLNRYVPGRRSMLHAWYVREWEILSGGAINWAWLMGEITQRKLTDRCGRLPTLQTARQTWYRVKREMEKRKTMAPVVVELRRPTSPPPSPRQPLAPVCSARTFSFPTAKDQE